MHSILQRDRKLRGRELTSVQRGVVGFALIHAPMLIRMEVQAVPTAPPIPRLAHSIAESEALSGLSRSSLYGVIAAGQFKIVQGGRRLYSSGACLAAPQEPAGLVALPLAQGGLLGQ